uniref:Mediator of RNA polymerase II transcription subunit 15 n=1 Tax=Rhinopithecus bieti TaxID=61621 RepID=A0A2K6JZ84_RHIBE
MDVSGQETDWRSTAFRQKLVSQIEDAMRKAGVAHNKSSKDMESHVFLKAKTRDEYLSLVARLIIHFRDIHNKKSQASVSDPMNALQSLTGGPAAGAAGIGMPPRGPGQSLGGMGSLGAMGQPMSLSGQPPPGTSGMAPHSMAVVSTATPQSEYHASWRICHFPCKRQHILFLSVVQQQQQQLQQQQQQQQHLIKLHHQNQQQVPGLLFLLLASLLQCEPWPPMQQPQPPPTQALPQQLQQMHHPQHHQPPPQPQQPPVAQNQPSQLPPQSQTQPLVSQAQALPGQMLYTQPPLKFVRAPMVVQQPPVQPQVQQQTAVQTAQAAQMVAPGVQMITEALAQGGMHIRARFPPTTAVSAVPSSSIPLGRQPMAQVSQSSLPMLSSPSPGQQVQTPQSMPPPPQPSPQPGQPGSQPNSNVRPALPGPWLTCFSHLSAAPALPHPPVASCPALHRTLGPSDGLTHLCPAVNPSSVMSPAGSSQAEEQQYLDKLKQLSKYIEPLRRMINKIDKNEDRKKDLSKMKTLHTAHGGSTGAWIPTPHRPRWPRPNSGSSLCQPLLTPVLGPAHSFAAMTAIHGPTHPAPVVCTRKRRLEDDERQSIPSVLQGEVARLDPKFLVNLDPSHCSNNGTVHLICKLDDKDLPSVPPLELSVPADYPAQSPLWIDRQWQYDANPFLQSVHRCMTSRLLQLPDKHSVTALLNTWAQSVHQACLSAA